MKISPQEQPVSFPVAKLAVEHGIVFKVNKLNGVSYYTPDGKLNGDVSAYLKDRDDRSAIEAVVIPAPTQSMLQTTLRDDYDIVVSVIPFCYPKWIEDGSDIADDTWSVLIYQNKKYMYDEVDFESYEEAFDDGLTNALPLIN